MKETALWIFVIIQLLANGSYSARIRKLETKINRLTIEQGKE